MGRRYALVLVVLAMLYPACSSSSPTGATPPATTPPTTLGPIFTRSGMGNNVFDMPTTVTRIRIQGAFGGTSSNFIVRIGGRLVVNELLGTSWGPTTYDGTHVTVGGVTEITNSAQVSWAFTEVR